MIDLYPIAVYHQALIVLNQGTTQATFSTNDDADRGTSYSEIHIQSGSTALSESQPSPQSMVFKETFSSVPVIWESDLHREYQELGVALLEMKSLDGENEHQLDEQVYLAASYVATELRANSFPLPSVFSHGPKSVVFNWSNNEDNLYLTVSADRMSALITSPERIQRRIEYPKSLPANPETTLLSIKSAFLKKSVQRCLTASASGQTQIVS